MAEPFVYDKAKYHFDGNFPADLEPEQGFVHTGMFLGWIVDHDLYDNEWFGPEMRSYLDAFKNRELTGPKLFEACDGVLLNDMLTPEGNALLRTTLNSKVANFSQTTANCLRKVCLPSITFPILGPITTNSRSALIKGIVNGKVKLPVGGARCFANVADLARAPNKSLDRSHGKRVSHQA
jgi:hypothetical protein